MSKLLISCGQEIAIELGDGRIAHGFISLVKPEPDTPGHPGLYEQTDIGTIERIPQRLARYGDILLRICVQERLPREPAPMLAAQSSSDP